MSNKFLVINTCILPDVYTKVIKAKNLIKTGKAKDITDAVKTVDISRSTFYKYKDYVFTVSEGINSHKITLSLMLNHKPGTLSAILDKIAENNGNILTINQDIPINNYAIVTITFDALKLSIDINNLIDYISTMENVIKIELIAME